MKRIAQAPARAGAVLLAAAALAGALDQLPSLVRQSHAYLVGPTYSLERSDEDPLQYFASTFALKVAKATIPNGAIYTVVVGNDPPLEDADPVAIQPIFQFWLLPDRYTPSLRAAGWVIAYHHAVATIGVRVRREVSLGPDGVLLQVAP